jgi:hypothetical protein
MARRPFTGRITDYYGPRAAPLPGANPFHAGLDGIGLGNLAPESGRVLSFGWVGTYGNLLRFLGDSGAIHYMAHNKSLIVPVGARADEGDQLAVQGMTGLATGVHVHWEVHPGGGRTIDPLAWLGSMPASINKTPIGETTMSAAEVEAIKAHIDASTERVKEAIRRDSRARLYFDAGLDGLTPESASNRAMAMRVTSGFIYPLASNPADRAGQVKSLRGHTGVHYLLIDKNEAFEGLATAQFDNLIEMANGHIRRIGADVLHQLDGSEIPETTSTEPRGSAEPTRVLE